MSRPAETDASKEVAELWAFARKLQGNGPDIRHEVRSGFAAPSADSVRPMVGDWPLARRYTPPMRDIHLKRSVAIAALFTATLWVVQAAGVVLELPVELLGVRPRQLTSLQGIVTAPLVHGSFAHLLANSPPLLVLGTAMLYGFPRAAKLALPVIWLGSGLGVWLFAREATHLGASGLTYGMMFFVFVIGMLRRDRPSMGLAMIVFFLYGSMVWGVLPLKPGISFESHLFGALTGIVAAVALRRRDPLAERRVYDWEKEDPDAEEQDPVIGDLWRDADGPEVPSRRQDEDN